MKQILKTLTIILVVIIVASCNQNSPAPSPATPSSPTSPTSNMSAFETSLVGSWKLKRSETRSTTGLPGLGDTVAWYTNHYNYSTSMFELTSNSSANSGYYDGIFGIMDNGNTYPIFWKGSPNNAITTLQGYGFTVKYISTDSLVLDYGGYRYYYNKNTITPKMNSKELQLLGNPWQLISQNGLTPTYPTFKIFKNNWSNSLGYFSLDSTVTTTGPTLSASTWEVLYPNRAVPILFGATMTYCKIISLTPNSLRIEGFNPTISSASTSTLIYSR